MVKQKLQPQHHGRSYECPQCMESISNPICHNCLGKQIISWLSCYPGIKKEIESELKKYLKSVNNLVSESILCIVCKEKKAALCPYCFMEGVFNLMKMAGVHKRILNDFVNIFNFDSDHTGYVKEAEEIGF